MNPSIVIDPACTFDTLVRLLGASGFKLERQGRAPLVPGEPESASFRRAAGEELHYTFNPACRLRVLEVPAVGVRGDGAIEPGSLLAGLAALPLVDSAAIAAWLSTTDERAQLRGVLAAGALGDASQLATIEILTRSGSEVIASAARQALTRLRATARETAQPMAEDAARRVCEAVRPLLESLALDPDGRITETLRPRAADYAAAFLPGAIEPARNAYEKLWAQSPRVTGVAADATVQCAVSPAGMLRTDNALSHPFPGGYRAIASLLVPERVWVKWAYVSPGRTSGLAFDGLVWLEDHWAWLPKPYCFLAAQARPRET